MCCFVTKLVFILLWTVWDYWCNVCEVNRLIINNDYNETTDMDSNFKIIYYILFWNFFRLIVQSLLHCWPYYHFIFVLKTIFFYKEVYVNWFWVCTAHFGSRVIFYPLVSSYPRPGVAGARTAARLRVAAQIRRRVKWSFFSERQRRAACL